MLGSILYLRDILLQTNSIVATFTDDTATLAVSEIIDNLQKATNNINE